MTHRGWVVSTGKLARTGGTSAASGNAAGPELGGGEACGTDSRERKGTPSIIQWECKSRELPRQ
jgi:hypothetical protein